MIEHDIFKRRKISLEKAEKFGFLRLNGEYLYERKIYDGMVARLIIDDRMHLSGDVYDEELGEKYVNHRVDSAEGAFVIGVRNAYQALLEEVAAAISTEKRYVFDQANRIDAFIANKYGVMPEFLWQKFPHFGVYRNTDTRKWFAIIMNIGRGKVVKGESGEVDVMNVKLDDLAERFLGKGVYPSYHMNHKSWVTILLDDTLDDETIAEMIEISFRNSFKKSKRK